MELLCKIREVNLAIGQFEQALIKEYDLSLNAGMLLCTLSKRKVLTSSELAEMLGLTCSNTSKIIRQLEEKEMIKRTLGKEDRRTMFFSLTQKGSDQLAKMKSSSLKVPEGVLTKLIEE